jgi:hypothetical protein
MNKAECVLRALTKDTRAHAAERAAVKLYIHAIGRRDASLVCLGTRNRLQNAFAQGRILMYDHRAQDVQFTDRRNDGDANFAEQVVHHDSRRLSYALVLHEGLHLYPSGYTLGPLESRTIYGFSHGSTVGGHTFEPWGTLC